MSNKRQRVDEHISWFNPGRCPTLGAQWPAAGCGLRFSAASGRVTLRARVPAAPGAGASTQEPPSPRAAAAASAPHTPLRLLERRLFAMAGPLKSVDYEVFGRVQGTA